MCSERRISPSPFPALVVSLLYPSFSRNVYQGLQIHHKRRSEPCTQWSLQWVLLTSAPSGDQFINIHSTCHAGITNSLYHPLQTWAASGPESLSDPWKLGYLGTSKIKRKFCTVQREEFWGCWMCLLGVDSSSCRSQRELCHCDQNLC